MTEASQPAYGRIDENSFTAATRRQILKGGAGLLIAFAGSRGALAGGEEPSLHAIEPNTANGSENVRERFAPGGFVRIAADGTINLIIPSIEMGQGVFTSQAMLIAEELEVGLDQISVRPAPPNENFYKQPLLGSQSTGGSTSVRGFWTILRQAGAAARTMLVNAAAARWNVPASECFVKRAVITHQPTGRTLTYGDVAEDAARQPVPQNVPLKQPKDFELIGKPQPRIEGRSKGDGTAIFGIDVHVPEMKVATVSACPVFGGRLLAVDDGAARQIPGVHDVIKTDNAVAVTGDHFWAAKRGLDALRITWDFGPNAGMDSAALVAALKSASENGKPILARREGDVDGAWHAAAKRIEAVYQLPFLAHATMEPINALVHVRPDGCDVWVGTQVPTSAQKVAAQVTGLPPEKVHIHNHLIGGGFGRRLEADSVAQAVAIAKQVNYPVKIIWTREEAIQHDMYRPAYYDHVSAGLNSDGMPVVWKDRVTGASILSHYAGLPEGQLDSDAVEGAKEPPYHFPAIQVDWVRQDPPVPVTWWRGVGPTHNVFVVESFIDELAHSAGKDPVDYRLALLKDNPRAAAVLKRAAEKADWGSSLPAGAGRGVALHDSFGSFVAAVVEIFVSAQGEISLRRVVGAVDCGFRVNPDMVKAQLEGGLIFGLSAALYNGITFRNGRTVQSNFNDYRMMRINEVPPMEMHIVETSEAPGGLGEPGTTAAAPALGNAIFAATGKRLRSYPFDRNELKRQENAQNEVVSSLSQEPAIGPAPLHAAPIAK